MLLKSNLIAEREGKRQGHLDRHCRTPSTPRTPSKRPKQLEPKWLRIAGGKQWQRQKKQVARCVDMSLGIVIAVVVVVALVALV